MNKLLSVLLALPVLVGCHQSTDHYYWGDYEDLIYVNFAQPGKFSPEQEVQAMEQDLQKANAAHKPIPPGFHAHLGNLYFQLGKIDLARQEFETEKRLFPESTALVNRMTANLPEK